MFKQSHSSNRFFNRGNARNLIQSACLALTVLGYQFAGRTSFLAGLGLLWLTNYYFDRWSRVEIMDLTENFESAISRLASIAEEVSDVANSLHGEPQGSPTKTTESSDLLEKQRAAIAPFSKKMNRNSQDHSRTERKKIADLLIAVGRIEQSQANFISQMKQNNSLLIELQDLISEIASKTGVINEIVFQSRLLSFNASLEAERAGESGRGFSVVAGEVRKLADSSGRSSTEIEKLIQKSIQRIKEMLESSHRQTNDLDQKATKDIQKISVVAAGCGDAMDRLIELVSELSEREKQLNGAVCNFDSWIDQIEVQVSHFNFSAQNQEKARQLVAASRRLAQEIVQLNEVSDSFSVARSKKAS